MRSVIIGFTVGILLLQQQANLLNSYTLIALICLAGLIMLLTRFIKLPVIRYTALAISGALLGWTWASAFAIIGLADRLPTELEERDITVTGVITSLPSQVEYGQRFQFAIERVLTEHIDPDQIPDKVMLSWYTPRSDDEQASTPTLHPGEHWQLKVRLRRPHGLANPHGFDYEVWLLEQGIGATGSVRSDDNNHLISNFVFSLNNCIEWARGQLRERILSALPNQPYAPILVALVIGEQNAITQNDWKIFARTGVSHLIAISGLHVTLLSGLFAGIMFFLWRKSFFTRYQLPLILPAQKVAALSGALMALLYVALAGFGVPAQRTLIMVSVAALACWMDRVTSVTNILCLALGLVLLVDPWAVLSPGFWLSFSAVGILFYVGLGRRESRRTTLSADNRRVGTSFVPTIVEERWAQTACPPYDSGLRFVFQQLRQASITQYAITLGLVPLTMLLFNQVSLVSPIANAVAIPVVSFLITPFALIGSILPAPLGSWVLTLTNLILQELIVFLSWLSEFSWSVWQAPRPEIWMFICALIGTAWCLAPKGWPVRWAGVLAWLPLALNTSEFPKANQLNVTAFDVGQGMALLIETQNHRMLYDTGAAYSSQTDAGSSVIYPYLKMRGITHLDGLMISHSDTDHAGGALTLMQQLTLGWVSSSMEPESNVVKMAAQRSQYTPCFAGQAWNWDGVQFEILHPDISLYDDDKAKPNAKSCTLKITNNAHSILLAGDIEAKQEKQLVKSIPDKLTSTVLLAPHHGSGTSSTMEFLQTVNPDIALFQLGYHNRYHHPKLAIWQRYADLGITRLRTDQSGAIVFQLNNAIKITKYRQSEARYWFAASDVE